jgi:hypothetical protein
MKLAPGHWLVPVCSGGAQEGGRASGGSQHKSLERRPAQTRGVMIGSVSAHCDRRFMTSRRQPD